MGKPKHKSAGSDTNKVRMLDGKTVLNCLYNGSAIGHGKFFAAMVDGQLLLDSAGRPVPYRSVGNLV